MKKLFFANGQVLTDIQMKNVKGGTEEAQSTLESPLAMCWIHRYDKDGHLFTSSYAVFGNNATQAAANANQECVNLIVTGGTGVYRCKYSCN